MTTAPIPHDLLDFLRHKRPTCTGLSTLDNIRWSFELTADRERDSVVGILELRDVVAADLDAADRIVDVRPGQLSDLTPAQRDDFARWASGRTLPVWIFADAQGRAYYAMAATLTFSTRPWLDDRITRAVLERNVAAGVSARGLVAESFCESVVGREVGCWRCLRRFRRSRDHEACPGCGWGTHAATTPERLLSSFLHGRAELWAGLDLRPLTERSAGDEVYRLFVFCYWCRHRVVECDRHRVRSWAWGGRPRSWLLRADRETGPEEWKRLGWLLDAGPFWELPPWGGGGGFDGADYALEGLRAGGYHVVERWCPQMDDGRENFAYACHYLQALGVAPPLAGTT